MHEASDDDLAAELLIQAQKAVGQRLRALRSDRRLSQADVAGHAGVHQSEWSRLEAGEIDPRLSWLLRVQHLFGIESLESLFGPLPSRRLLGSAAQSRRGENSPPET
jgi:transcriptional regulator with XRE-family HTH domain